MASGDRLCSSLEQRVESSSEENINSVLVGHFLAVPWKQPLTFLCVHSLYPAWKYISTVYCPIQRLTSFVPLTPVSEILWKTRLSCLWWNMLVSEKICCYYCSFKEADDKCKLLSLQSKVECKVWKQVISRTACPAAAVDSTSYRQSQIPPACLSEAYRTIVK